MESKESEYSVKPAAVFEHPLVLTFAQDVKGFLFNHIGALILFVFTCTSVLAVLLIFLFVAREAFPFLGKFSVVEFLTRNAWYPEASEGAEYGALALIVGSVYVTTIALAFSVPIGVLSAIFLSDIVSFKIRGIIKPIIEILAAIPSVAYGFFAVLVLAPWLQKHLGFATGTNALNSSLLLSIMALPTIISVAEDSISATGRDLREASYGLGATRFETMLKVVIPASHSGIIAGVVLGMMRAIGETMVVWMASGNASQIPHPWWDLSQSIRTMTASIAGEMGETVKGSDHYRSLFTIGLLLLVMTLLLNLVSEYFLSRARKSTGKS
ncbi:MAG: phosphate ABC transporter permease subunit PstC [Sedimentisphaerales bacterium]|nr:phosphate ABC transporter permease subunit PstC [Sedimentisphaerales bacterium]